MKYNINYYVLTCLLVALLFFEIRDNQKDLDLELDFDLDVPNQSQVIQEARPVLSQMEIKEKEYRNISKAKLLRKFDNLLKNKKITEFDRVNGYYQLTLYMRQTLGTDFDEYCNVGKKRLEEFEEVLKEKGFGFYFYNGYCRNSIFSEPYYKIKVFI